jgi:quercetin dioxygenase-like cupin family protein
MQVQRAVDAAYQRGDDARFTGEVWLRAGPGGPDGTNVGIVHFSPGARTHWHAHPAGQFLYGVAGRGWVRSRDEDGTWLVPGDVLWVPPGEWHFHAGGPVTPLVHFAVNGGGAPSWGDPVSEEEYEAGR